MSARKAGHLTKDTQTLMSERRFSAQLRLSQLENIGAFVASEDIAKHLTLTRKAQGDLKKDHLELLEASPADLAAADKSYEAHVYEAHLTKNRAALQKAINDIRECGTRELQGRSWWKRQYRSWWKRQ